MLIALASAFALSQAFRTVTAMMASQLKTDFSLTPQQLGVFAGTFHFTFGAMQLFMGIGIDLHGVRRTILAAFPVAVAGALLSALAHDFWVVVAGQALIGVGCAPAFLVCTVFIARRFPVARFASVSGLVMGIGGIGMLLTATPLAWVVQHSSWRNGFLLLAAGSALAWIAVFIFVREEAAARNRGGETVMQAVRQFGSLFALPHTWGIVALGSVTYASFITLRGLWLGPLLIERYGFSLVASGNVALAVSIVSLFGPPLFGRFDPNGARRGWITGFTAAMAALFAVLAFVHVAALAVAIALVVSFLTGYIILQYADVRIAYPEALTGRAMAVFTMAMFLGIALMQWLTGVAATVGAAHGVDPFEAVMLTTAVMLAAGAAAFRLLPAPR
ncbi:MFS transporter [Caenimonas aquaedulcis]|uniref:MFS transporter n=1 Tax=Caenimonas aquaedulcis TaxID=2793270 RepID=A0A931H141_9BURK|nr:MFS transporter [Caenimonas aquaedulcis]MBG9386632.1 MFS transporter [Caenimonas aquaedulcis]